MNSTTNDAICDLMAENGRMREALQFYADDNNYWGRPISLDLVIDRPTLRIVNEHHKETKVLKDRGNKARAALGSNVKLRGAQDER